MKRTGMLLCSVGILAAAVLAGCGADTNTGSEITDHVTVSTISVASEAEEQTASVAAAQEQLEHGDVTQTYPVLTLEDPAAQAAANEVILRDAETFAAQYLQDKDGEPLEQAGALESTVIPHQDTVSIVTTGAVTQEDGAATLVYTTNLSLATGERVSTGVRENAQAAAALIRSGKAVVLTADQYDVDEAEEYLQGLKESKLTALLSGCDYTDSDDQPTCFSYFMDEDTDDIGVYLPMAKGKDGYALLLLHAADLAGAGD